MRVSISYREVALHLFIFGALAIAAATYLMLDHRGTPGVAAIRHELEAAEWTR